MLLERLNNQERQIDILMKKLNVSLPSEKAEITKPKKVVRESLRYTSEKQTKKSRTSSNVSDFSQRSSVSPAVSRIYAEIKKKGLQKKQIICTSSESKKTKAQDIYARLRTRNSRSPETVKLKERPKPNSQRQQPLFTAVKPEITNFEDYYGNARSKHQRVISGKNGTYESSKPNFEEYGANY